jgi:membrane associated rhomboid family serine protease
LAFRANAKGLFFATISAFSMPRHSSPYASSLSFGPGPLSSAMKALILANVAMFLVTSFAPAVVPVLGLVPMYVLYKLWVWQVATYMFLHGGIFHILFNMLALWMFGTELERLWGTRFFLKYYFVTGVGAGLLTTLFSLLPFAFAQSLQHSVIIGASGAIYGLLLAYGLYFPDRPIYMYFVFPIPAKVFVLIMGAIAFYSSMSDAGGGIANATHLGGIVVGYLYLKGGKSHPLAELKYRYLKWKINRVRKKFDVYSGGRADDWDRHVH